MAFLDKKSIQALMTLGHIRGDGFTLMVSHWDQFKGGAHHDLQLKIYATVYNLPLFRWNAEAIATIISGFGIPHRASRSSLQWEDLRSFDIVFFSENIESIPEVIKVTTGSHIYSVNLTVNYVVEQGPSDSSSSSEDDSNGDGGDDWEFWNDSDSRTPNQDAWRHRYGDEDRSH